MLLINQWRSMGLAYRYHIMTLFIDQSLVDDSFGTALESNYAKASQGGGTYGDNEVQE